MTRFMPLTLCLLWASCADDKPELGQGDAAGAVSGVDAGAVFGADAGGGAGGTVGQGTQDSGPQSGFDAGSRSDTTRDAGSVGPGPSPADAGTSRDGSGPAPRDSGSTSPATPDSGVAPAQGVWKPKAATTWQWDLSGTVTKLDVAADVYDIDGFENDAALVAQLHAKGKKVICYLSVGTYEPDRPDAKDFPKEVLGKYWPEWNETYVDIRSEGLRAVMKKRLDMCKAKGFDGVEPDNMDMFEGGMNDTGFPLTEADGIAYAKWLATETHARGMSIGQKNASSITADIESMYDWALTEDCFADGWCDDLKSYPEHDKAMFMCEYTDTNVDFVAACAAAKTRKFSAILKNRDLDSSIEFCK